MMSPPGALAIFVKTPERSPVKTRLAATVGAPEAEAFYIVCLGAVEAVAHQASAVCGLDVYWAVAEADSLTNVRWRRFTTICQGEGGLGLRLARVYSELLERHQFVILIGADAPLLTSDLITTAAQCVTRSQCPFAISRAGDGGYALFAGRNPIPETAWTSVPYSSPETATAFVDRLKSHGAVCELPRLDDVDTFGDLVRLVSGAGTQLLTPEQRAVLENASSLARRFSGQG
jgi:glycosyltransferase A (GT-A) superfamily protein (DUF2064 family)